VFDLTFSLCIAAYIAGLLLLVLVLLPVLLLLLVLPLLLLLSSAIPQLPVTTSYLGISLSRFLPSPKSQVPTCMYIALGS
jgi:hypothetical protein